MRGSTPLDVAAASCIDNNELALALQEQDLEMVCENYNKKKITRKDHTWKGTLDLLSYNLLGFLHMRGDIGGDILSRLRAADVSNAPF